MSRVASASFNEVVDGLAPVDVDIFSGVYMFCERLDICQMVLQVKHPLRTELSGDMLSQSDTPLA